jgi:hypothetical protein
MEDELYNEGVIANPAPSSETGLPWGDIETDPEWEELLILCIDVSKSMGAPHHASLPGWSRTHEVIRHLFDPGADTEERDSDSLYHALEISQGRQRFWTALITFGLTAKVIMPPVKLVSPDGNTVYRPDFASDQGLQELLFAHEAGTAIGSGLKLAYETALRWVEEETTLPRLVTIAIISDGKAHKDPIPAKKYAMQVNAQQLEKAQGRRPQIQIATACYGHQDPKQTDWPFLQDLATHDGLTKIAATGQQLRNFLESSVKA